jgi:hypothetical protein
MQLEATKEPIKYRLKTGKEIMLRPGVPTELPDEAANQLLKKAPDKVRRVDQVPAIHIGDSITWRGANDTTRGPGIVDFFHTDQNGTVWAFVTLSDGWAAVNTKYALTNETHVGR